MSKIWKYSALVMLSVMAASSSLGPISRADTTQDDTATATATQAVPATDDTNAAIPAEQQIFTQEIQPLPAIKSAFIPSRGSGMERSPSKIQLKRGAKVQIRVTNGVGNVNMQLVTMGRDTDVGGSVPANGNWVEFTAAADSALVFFQHDTQSWPQAPQVEYRISSGTGNWLTSFHYGDDQAEFLNRWNASGGTFGFVDDPGVSMLLGDSERRRLPFIEKWSDFKSLNDAIESYHKLIANYDAWLGVEDNAAEVYNANPSQRYFVRPDINGFGGAYYTSGQQVGYNGDNIGDYLSGGNTWLILHEVGHGYDGRMVRTVGDNDLELAEVWNNIYAYRYQSLVNNKPAWIYPNGNKQQQHAVDDNDRYAHPTTFSYAGLDYRNRLDFMLRIHDLLGPDSFPQFNRNIREAQANGMEMTRTTRVDMITRYWGLRSGVNLAPFFKAYGMNVSPSQMQEVMNHQPETMAMPVSDYFKDINVATAVATQLGVGEPGALVKTRDLRKVSPSLTLRVTADINDPSQIEGGAVSLVDGKDQVATATFVNGVATFAGVPLGSYTLRFPQNKTTFEKPASSWVHVTERDTPVASVHYGQSADTNLVGSSTTILTGLANETFARIDYDRSAGKLNLRAFERMPHSYFSDAYATVKFISPSGEVLADRSYIGSDTIASEYKSMDAPIGTRLVITHKEPHRVVSFLMGTGISRPDLKNRTSPTTYVVTKFGLAKLGEEAETEKAFAAESESRVKQLMAVADKSPNADISAEVADLQAAFMQLSDGLREPLLGTYKEFIDTHLGAVQDTKPEAPATPEPEPTTPAVDPAPAEPTTPATPATPETPAEPAEPAKPAATEEPAKPATPATTPASEPAKPAPSQAPATSKPATPATSKPATTTPATTPASAKPATTKPAAPSAPAASAPTTPAAKPSATPKPSAASKPSTFIPAKALVPALPSVDAGTIAQAANPVALLPGLTPFAITAPATEILPEPQRPATQPQRPSRFPLGGKLLAAMPKASTPAVISVPAPAASAPAVGSVTATPSDAAQSVVPVETPAPVSATIQPSASSSAKATPASTNVAAAEAVESSAAKSGGGLPLWLLGAAGLGIIALVGGIISRMRA